MFYWIFSCISMQLISRMWLFLNNKDFWWRFISPYPCCSSYVPVCRYERVSSVVCHTGRPLLHCLVCVPGDAALLWKSRGKSRSSCVNIQGFPQGGAALTLFHRRKKHTHTRTLWRLFEQILPSTSLEAAAHLVVKKLKKDNFYPLLFWRLRPLL